MYKAKISIRNPEFYFLEDIEAKSFKISFYSEEKKKRIQLENLGDIITDDNYKILSELNIGTRFIISDITNKNKCDRCTEFISIIQIELVE